MKPAAYSRALVFSLVALGQTLSLYASAAAPSETLVLTPKQCVALTQGQTCYVDATLDWTSPTKGSYCLFSSAQDAPLSCWQQQQQGRFRAELAVDKNVVFTLKMKDDSVVKASQLLKVTWVHQKRGQPRGWWRIF